MAWSSGLSNFSFIYPIDSKAFDKKEANNWISSIWKNPEYMIHRIKIFFWKRQVIYFDSHDLSCVSALILFHLRDILFSVNKLTLAKHRSHKFLI